MFAWLTSRPNRAKAGELYGAVVAVARTPGYYSNFRVPDTTRGRFEMVVLVLFLVLERLKSTVGGMDLSRTAIEAFITDMDDCMREMGVGDLTVPKKVKRAAAAFYERAKDYREALAGEGNGTLASALSRHVWDAVAAEDKYAPALADVVRQQAEALERADDATLACARALVGVLQEALENATNGTTRSSQQR